MLPLLLLEITPLCTEIRAHRERETYAAINVDAKQGVGLILRPLDGQDKRRICVNRCSDADSLLSTLPRGARGSLVRKSRWLYIYMYIDRGKLQDRFPPGNDATRIIYERENRDSARGVVPSKGS